MLKKTMAMETFECKLIKKCIKMRQMHFSKLYILNPPNSQINVYAQATLQKFRAEKVRQLFKVEFSLDFYFNCLTLGLSYLFKESSIISLRFTCT